jgi:hypothetical protein
MCLLFYSSKIIPIQFIVYAKVPILANITKIWKLISIKFDPLGPANITIVVEDQ